MVEWRLSNSGDPATLVRVSSLGVLNTTLNGGNRPPKSVTDIVRMQCTISEYNENYPGFYQIFFDLGQVSVMRKLLQYNDEPATPREVSDFMNRGHEGLSDAESRFMHEAASMYLRGRR
jgi:hypothetical protein